MVETLTPAVCGGRHRQVVAVTLFTVASVAAAATVGGVLGWTGGAIGHRRALLAIAAVVALVAALREAGIVRIGVPDLKRQVPEHWRRSLPLPVWSSGYGAILGSGFGTYQPAATYWVMLSTVTAIGRPVAGAACMAIFGLARGMMVVLPGGGLLGRFAAAHRAIRPANALVLAALVVAATPAVAQAEAWPAQNGIADPSLSYGNLAYTRWVAGVPQVEVREANGTVHVFPGGRLPSLYRKQLAYEDDQGIRLVNWVTGAEIRRIRGAVTKPAVFYAYIAFVRSSPYANRLQVLNRGTGRVYTLARISPYTEIGRPSIAGRTVAWHQTDGGGHLILKRRIGARRAVVFASGARRYQVRDPALGWGRTAWIYSDAEFTTVWVRNSRGVTKAVATTKGPRYMYTNLTIGKRKIIVTRWNLLSVRAVIDTIPLIGV